MPYYITRSAVFLTVVTLAIGCQQQATETQSEQAPQELVVEAACGQCQFGLPETTATWPSGSRGQPTTSMAQESTIMAMRIPTRVFVMRCERLVCKGGSRTDDSWLNRSSYSLTKTSRFDQSCLTLESPFLPVSPGTGDSHLCLCVPKPVTAQPLKELTNEALKCSKKDEKDHHRVTEDTGESSRATSSVSSVTPW